VTVTTPFQRRFVVCRLGLAVFNPHTKFEVSIITCNKRLKGNAIYNVTKRTTYHPIMGMVIVTWLF